MSLRCHIVMLIIVFAAAADVADGAAPDLAAEALYRETIQMLDDVEVRSDQKARIKELADRYGPEIRDLYLTPAVKQQILARDETIARAVAQGLRGARAREFVRSALQSTAEERAAYTAATQLRKEFDQAVRDVLTVTQRDRLQQPERRESASADRAHSGYLIVQLAPRLRSAPESAKTLDDSARALELPGLRRAIEQHRLEVSERAVQPELLDRLAKRGVVQPDRQGESPLDIELQLLRTFWQIDARGLDTAEIEAAVASLNALPEVEVAYAALALDEPSACSGVNPADDTHYLHQGYLSPAPDGIDAPAAWRVSGGQGAGVGIVDLERGWNIDHEDLDALLTLPWYGDRLPGNDHGTGVFGEMIAEDSNKGIVGAAPCVDYAATTSRYSALTGATEPVHKPLLAALSFMDPGDILLIEAQTTTTNYPVEIEPLNYSAIRTAVLSGVIVVEPAGNGGHDLDAYRRHGRPVLDRSYRDSGAIMVGASDPMNVHNKAGASCYGARVDCFGWGNHVATTSRSDVADVLDDGGGDHNRSYRSRFSGTSSAAPMVASAAVLVQGLWKSKFGVPLTSVEMREILSNPATGTPQGTAVLGHIGVMPNLNAIIAANGLDDDTPPVPTRTVDRPMSRPAATAPRGRLICPPCPCDR